MSVFIFGLVVYWCVRYLFSFPLLCASTFYALRLPTEYERNGRYEGSRWGKRFLLKIFYRYLPHFCGRGNTPFLNVLHLSLLQVELLSATSSMWSGSIAAAAGTWQPREGAGVLQPPAGGSLGSQPHLGSHWCLGVKIRIPRHRNVELPFENCDQVARTSAADQPVA